MEIHGMTPQSINKAADDLPSTKKKDAQLQKACKEFESLFLNQLLTSMRKTIPKAELGAEEGNEKGESHEKEVFDEMMDQELAKTWAQSDGIGLANVLYQQLKKGKT
jgi:peptidoglycan hydrolase FlgJ